MITTKLKSLTYELMEDQHFDTCSVGVIDFSQQNFEVLHCGPWESEASPWFDLASLTKPFTLGALALITPKIFLDEKYFWLLNHRAGLPSGGRLSCDTWREQILNYPLTYQNEDTYSDYSALRLMLELEKNNPKNLYSLANGFWDQEIVHWLQVSDPLQCRPTGFRRGEVIQGVVNDDNAFVIKEELSHAGLFGTAAGVCQSLLNLWQQSQNFEALQEAFKKIQTHERFILGFDRAQNLNDTLAGEGCSRETFGHLGFTGTSFWCDLKQKKGWVLLTNATQNYSYSRQGLKHLRQSLGQAIWKI